MSNYSASNDPEAQQLAADFRKIWQQVPVGLRSKLNNGADALTAEEIALLVDAEDRAQTGRLARLAVGLTAEDGSPGKHTGITYAFADWARTEAPSEDGLAD